MTVPDLGSARVLVQIKAVFQAFAEFMGETAQQLLARTGVRCLENLQALSRLKRF